MSKFKVGDKVIITKHVPLSDGTRIRDVKSQIGTVHSFYKDKYAIKFEDCERYGKVYEDEMELEAVYNSPLYNALK